MNDSQGSSELGSLLRNPQCCLKVLVICKCELGLSGVVNTLQLLSENHSLEELNLADNINPDEIQALTSNSRSSGETHSFSPGGKNETDSLKAAASELVDALPQEMCVLNTSYHQLEVADSEDELAEGQAALSGAGNICTQASPNRILPTESQPMRDFTAAIQLATSLKLLDLSGNGFSQEVTDILFSAWSSRDGAGLARRHVDGKTVHYSLQGHECCGIKSCCRKI